MPVVESALRRRELMTFALVGGSTWIIDTAVFLVLKNTQLLGLAAESKPLTAKVIAVVVATAVSYVLHRDWSFRTRGGRDRGPEAGLFFVISGLSVIVYTLPLAVSRYVLDLKEPAVSMLTQEVADFVSGQILGVLLGMAFRWWALRRYVFPERDARNRQPARAG